jgi:hypothetical protein
MLKVFSSLATAGLTLATVYSNEYDAIKILRADVESYSSEGDLCQTNTVRSDQIK